MKPEDLHYLTAHGHAEGIRDAARGSMRQSGWVAAKVPLEAEAMVEAIAKKMNVGPKMGQRHVPLSIIRQAVEDVLGGIQPGG